MSQNFLVGMPKNRTGNRGFVSQMMNVYEQLSFSFMDEVKPCKHEWICGSPVYIENKWLIKTKCIKCGEPMIVEFSNKNYYEADGLREYKQLLEERKVYDKNRG